MSIIALLNPFEAIVSGETMVVQFPSDYGTYRIDGKEFPSLYNKQLVMSRESTIEKVKKHPKTLVKVVRTCLLYTSPSPRDRTRSRMPSSA